MAQESTTTLTTADGVSLFSRQWLPENAPVATIAIVHGLGEHCGRYEHVAAFFVDNGYAVFAADLRGHGQSDGQRGHIGSFDDYLTDVSTLLNHARQQNPTLPLFLMGHSMGGLIVLTYALKHPAGLAAVIASGPGLRSRVAVPGWKLMMGNVMSGLYPTLSMSNGLSADGLSTDRSVVEAYLADPLVHDRVTARWAKEFFAAGEQTMEQAHTLAVPTLILQGGNDPIVDPAGSREFFNRIKIEDKHHIEYPTLLHEIFNEPQQQSVFNDMQAWLLPRLP